MSNPSATSGGFMLAVLNPGGRDADQDFPDFAGNPDSKIHAPVNFHGYAAATGGAFLRSVAAVEKRDMSHVVLLLRSDLNVSLKALRDLTKRKCRVYISFKESGLHQVAQTLLKPGNTALLRQLCSEADGALSSTEDLLEIYRMFGARRVAFIPTPYPVLDKRWDFSIPAVEREGIFVGTREFDVPSRHHALALSAAFWIGKETGQLITVVNEDGRSGRKRIESLAAAWPGVEWSISEGRRPYPEYLKNMARHKIVWQLDGSAVPGQVAGDALLCRIPCVGGNGATERLAFPMLTSHLRTVEQVKGLATRLLGDSSFYEEICESSQACARETIGFEVVAEQLREAFSIA